MNIAFTGHRSDKIGGFSLPNPTYNYVCQQTEKILLELKPDKCISGMAIGYDSYACNVCIKLKIPFIAAIPFLGQEKMWPQKSQNQYKRLLSFADEIKIVSDGGYSAHKMQIRNQWMTDNCDILLACWNGTDGGTKNCIDYANKIGKKIIRINPKNIYNVDK